MGCMMPVARVASAKKVGLDLPSISRCNVNMAAILLTGTLNL